MTTMTRVIPLPNYQKINPEMFDDFGRFNLDYVATVLAFDPGETTGWCVMAIEAEKLLAGPVVNWDDLLYCDYGQIDCVSTTVDGWSMAALKTANWNTAGENIGVDRMMTLCKTHLMACVVCEDFIPDMKKFDQARHTLSPVRLMAAFSYALHNMNWQSGLAKPTPFFIQNRSLAKTTCTDDRLKNFGLYDSNGGRHARDATRHAFYFLRDCSIAQNGSAYRRHLAWPHIFGDPADTIYDPRSASRKPRSRKLGDII